MILERQLLLMMMTNLIWVIIKHLIFSLLLYWTFLYCSQYSYPSLNFAIEKVIPRNLFLYWFWTLNIKELDLFLGRKPQITTVSDILFWQVSLVRVWMTTWQTALMMSLMMRRSMSRELLSQRRRRNRRMMLLSK